ncbi:MAG: serine/threonine-protein phosphatase [Anaerolineae bacterium]|nr:serine/threonine-protein phosphatase [Anaerolineae bacterium]
MRDQLTMQVLSPSRKQPLFGQSTHKGAIKKPNEDAYGAFSIAFGNEDSYILAVADGVTGESGGQLASRLAIDTIHQTLQANIKTLPTAFSHTDVQRLLEQSILQADKQIKDTARSHNSGMSTTIVAAFIMRGFLYVAHVGDSRAYLYRNRSLHLLTRDHTYAEEMIQQGKLTRKVAEQKANRNVITRYLGPGPVPVVDLTLIPLEDAPENQSSVNCIRLQPGDRVLLCSDGLTSKVTKEEISHILRKEQDHLQRSTDQLIKKALEKQEPDNITAVLFRIPHQGEGPLFSPGFLWRVGLFLFTLLFIFAISLYLIQAPKLTETSAIAETKNVMPSLTSPTAFPTPTSSSTVTASSVNVSMQPSTATSVSAASQPDVVTTVTPVTPDPTATATATLTPSLTLPTPTIAGSEDIPDTLEQAESSLQSKQQMLEIDVKEENDQYVVEFINPTSPPPQTEGVCVEIVIYTQEFVKEQKPSEGLGKCDKEKSIDKDALKPGINYVSLWQYDLSSKEFVTILSNQVGINIGSRDGSGDESSCITGDIDMDACLDE